MALYLITEAQALDCNWYPIASACRHRLLCVGEKLGGQCPHTYRIRECLWDEVPVPFACELRDFNGFGTGAVRRQSLLYVFDHQHVQFLGTDFGSPGHLWSPSGHVAISSSLK